MLDDQVILVTGGGSGLGLAQVERFRSEGARVAVLEKVPERCEQLKDRFSDVLVRCGDATQIDENRTFVGAALQDFGHIDVVVANTGIWDSCMPLSDLPEDERLKTGFDEMFSTNVLSYLLAAKASHDALRESRGSMILTASPASFNPGGGGPLYVASKHAVLGLIRQLAYELAPDVRVNGVAPGSLDSNLAATPSALAGFECAPAIALPREDLIRELSPLEYAASAEDYAGVYVMLASREMSRTMTGTVVECDGGERVRGRRETSLAKIRIANARGASGG